MNLKLPKPKLPESVEMVYTSGAEDIDGLRIADQGPGGPGASFRFLNYLQGKDIKTADRFLKHLVDVQSEREGIIAGDS